MVSSSRRAFLMGRRPPQTAWQTFCSRLNARVQGEWSELSSEPDHEQARLEPASSADVHLVLTLAAEYGVTVCLEGVPQASETDGPLIVLAPGRQMARCDRLEPNSNRWFVQPGCLLGEMEAKGFQGLANAPAGMTVAAWLADRRQHDWPTGRTALSGVLHCSVILADNTQAALGPFGQENRNPLDSLRMQQLIPALFQLMGESETQALRQEQWPCRYRLDALEPVEGEGINLAHLMLGHGGDLAWVEWLVLDDAVLSGSDPQDWSWPNQEQSWQAQDVDSRIKALFDPADRFSYPGQTL
jgi:hypothetical protein